MEQQLLRSALDSCDEINYNYIFNTVMIAGPSPTPSFGHGAPDSPQQQGQIPNLPLTVDPLLGNSTLILKATVKLNFYLL